ncbi:MAG: hypothetical protein PWP37_583 [Thermotogota bacterium]|nr:hypothetical protein [Thermotogota bacterium]
MKRAIVFLLVIIFATVLSMFFSVAAFLKVTGIQLEMRNELAAQNNRLTERIEAVQGDVEKLKTLIGPGGSVEKLLTKTNYVEKILQDVEQVLTEMQSDEMVGYFQIFISGKDRVWIGIKESAESSRYIFSKELKPGLAPYRFYFFKRPTVETRYAMVVSPDCVIETGNPSKTVLLIYNQGVSKAVTMDDFKINGLAKKYDLYIPGR